MGFHQGKVASKPPSSTVANLQKKNPAKHVTEFNARGAFPFCVNKVIARVRYGLG